MGFDNECILNIQSLAGEYFCPVCRLLVYPNEALQSQCTHLYCKPCLTYVVSTTKACPYDGYLVTEADAKPLLESNKALADTIGKIEVHCLYHRSGCTWQGPLSECTSHCSGCAFGSSPVVCNRCGIQIIHREVQEHAQNCPGVQSQVQQADGAQNAAATGTATTADQNLTAPQAGTVTSQAQTSQATVTTTPGQDANQQSNLNPQASLPTSDQWYQQQQYQQYYQQFPGYDPYQQQYQMYYPYQQPAALQYQQQHSQTHPPQAGQQQPPPQAQSQPQQPPAHSQPLAHAPTAATPQNQAQVSMQQQNHPAVQPHSQIQSQAPMPIHGHPHPQPYSQAQPNQQPNLQHPQMPEPEPTTEVLFLCSYDSCGRTFFDASALRKHSHIHGERQCICHYEGCGKKFLDSSKLKRHFLIHTGERNFVCPHEGCGKAFSLDFNLRSHMKTHSRENYHICPYRDCGKKYAHEYKLKNHITSHHEKFVAVEVTKYAPPTEKPSKVAKPTTSVYVSASPDRPYACPYEECEKAYIHEYKLKLHLRREHPDHISDENADNDVDEISNQDTRAGKRFKGKTQKQSKHNENMKLPPSKVVRKPWRVKEEAYEEEKDSEDTEEEGDKVEDGWRFAENNEEDDEETEDED